MLPRREATTAQWESHRTEIHTLYLAENKSLKDVMSHMKEKHGFNATKAQYERMFKTWKLRKNLSQSEWEFVHHRIQKRKLDDKESELYVNGIKIPNKRVKKETSRHSRPVLSATRPDCNSVARRQTPEGISVRSPVDQAFFTFSLKKLPWFQFQDFAKSQVNVIRGLNTVHASGLDPWARQHPFNSAPLHSPTQGNNIHSTPGISAPALTWLFPELPSATQEPDLIDNIPSVYSNLRATALLQGRGGESTTIPASSVEPFNRHTLPQLVRFAVYLASNNMLTNDQTDELLRWIINNKQESMLESLLSIKMPTIEAFARRIFESAQHIQDTNIVRILLKAGADPNLPTGRQIGIFIRGAMPLSIAILRENFELARILLDAGAEVIAGHTLIVAASKKSSVLVQRLLDAGAAVNTGRGRTALQYAAQNGHTEVVRILLDAGAQVNARYESPTNDISGTALQYAALNGHTDVVRILLGAGAEVNASPPIKIGGTALQCAAASGYTELAQMLLGAGANVNAPASQNGGTALQSAVTGGNIELVRILLVAGANINAPGTGFGQTALEKAALKGNIELVHLLLDSGADITCASHALLAAALGGNIGLVRLFLSAGADVNAPREESALREAVRNGDIELVLLLLDAGAEVNNRNITSSHSALKYAVQSWEESIELVSILVHAGADIDYPYDNEYDRTELQKALEEGDTGLVQDLLDNLGNESRDFKKYKSNEAMAEGNTRLLRLLMDSGDYQLDVGEFDGTELQLAAACIDQSIELVQILLDAGADINAPAAYRNGRTALQAATVNKNIELIQFLLNEGADVNAPAAVRSGMTALQTAAAANSIELVKIFLDAGADISARAASGYGRTALQAAVSCGNTELVKLLLAAGADINAPEGEGSGITLLEEAMDSGDGNQSNEKSLVQILLDAGANVNASSSSSWSRTAIQAAARIESIDLVQMLLDADADVNSPAAGAHGRTALQSAAENGNNKLARLLIDAGADVNAAAGAYAGITALQGTAIKGNISIALMLLNAGADVNAAPAMAEGRSALEGAAEHGRLDMVQLLLSAGADTEDMHFERAVEFAEKEGHYAVAKFLENYSG